MCHLSSLYMRQRLDHRRHQRPKHYDVVTRGMDHDDRDRKIGEVLLILQVAVNRKKDVNLLCSKLQQVAASCASCSNAPFLTPAHPASLTVLTSCTVRSFRSPSGTHSSSNTRIGHQVGFRLFQSRNREPPE